MTAEDASELVASGSRDGDSRPMFIGVVKASLTRICRTQKPQRGERSRLGEAKHGRVAKKEAFGLELQERESRRSDRGRGR